MNWKKFCESDLWIQCNLTQNPSSSFESGWRRSKYRPAHRRQDSSELSQPDSKTNWDSIIIKKVWCEHTWIDKQTYGRKRLTQAWSSHLQQSWHCCALADGQFPKEVGLDKLVGWNLWLRSCVIHKNEFQKFRLTEINIQVYLFVLGVRNLLETGQKKS